MVPVLPGEMSEEELISSLEEQETTSTHASSSQPAKVVPKPEREDYQRRLVAYFGIAASDTGGMSGSSISSSTSGTFSVAISANSEPLEDNALVVWLIRADWLAMPTQPNASLIKPPQRLT